jgi:hypothetical protein
MAEYRLTAEEKRRAVESAERLRIKLLLRQLPDRLEWERYQLTQGICPRSLQRITPNGILRPACSFCDCGEEDRVDENLAWQQIEDLDGYGDEESDE